MWLILTLITIVLIALLIPRRGSKIPKIIWTYWHDKTNLPKSVQMCIDSWRRHCPGWDIRILSESDTEKYRHSDDSYQRHADFVRLDVIRRYGGLWMDASVYLNRPIDWIFDDPEAEFSGYRFKRFSVKESWPFIENWFIAAPQGSRFIEDWYTEFMKYNSYETVEEYIQNEIKDVDYSTVPNVSYHLAYISCQKCLQKNGPYTLNLKDADTDGFIHLEETGWNYEEAAKRFLNGYYKTTNLVKLTGPDRKIVNDNMNDKDKI